MNQDTVTQVETSDAPQAPTDDQVRAVLDGLNVAVGSNLIGILQDTQDRLGYLPANALAQIARRTRIPLSRVYGVVSFYAQFHTEPHGKHTIRCCRGTACHVRGADNVIDSLRRVLGVDDGQTTPDMLFHLETVACLGTCFLAPVMMVDSQYFGQLNSQSIESILQSYRSGS